MIFSKCQAPPRRPPAGGAEAAEGEAMGIHDGHRERVRRRFLENDLDGFADHEALELLLYYAIPQGDVNPLAHELIDRFGSLSGVFTAPVEMLTEVKGVGERTAVLLRLAMLIARKARLADLERELIMDTRERVGAYLLELFAMERNEAVYQLCLDGKGKLLTCKRLGEGSVSAVTVDVRAVVQNAILCSASSVILAHNHPSGIALPSEEDRAVTDRVKAVLASISVRLDDHIIVADQDFVSFAESGYLL